MYTNSTSSFGFLFKMNTEVAYRAQIYSSSNHLDPNHHPKLILCYKFPENLNNTGRHNDILLNFKQRTNTIEIYHLTTDQKISHCTVLNTFGEEMPTEIFANTIKLKNNLSAGVYIIKLKIDGVWVSKKIAISL